MVVLFALFGALVVGLTIGLLYRGMVFVGDRRQLDVLTEQLMAEQRISALTRQTLAQMRRAASEHFRGPGR